MKTRNLDVREGLKEVLMSDGRILEGLRAENPCEKRLWIN